MGGYNCAGCCGNVFEIAPDGTYTPLHDFNGNDGSSPEAGMTLRNGKLYGTTFGQTNAYGTVFELTPATGALKTLHSFPTGDSDGLEPGPGTLLRDNSVNLYGTTEFGGSGSCPPYGGCGTVYELSPK